MNREFLGRVEYKEVRFKGNRLTNYTKDGWKLHTIGLCRIEDNKIEYWAILKKKHWFK